MSQAKGAGADEYKWVWIGACYLIFCNILFNVILILAHQYLGGESPCPPTGIRPCTLASHCCAALGSAELGEPRSLRSHLAGPRLGL